MEKRRQEAEKTASLELEIKLLREEIRLLKAKLYGRSTETKKALLKDQQPELFEPEEVLTEGNDEPEEAEQETVTSRRRKGGKRKPIPDHFPRREVVHDIAADEKICDCGTERKRIGEEVSEQLDVIPAQVEVIRHIRPKYACPGCEGLESTEGAVVVGRAPKQMLPKSLAGPGLLADVITAKFADAIPFYRHEKRLERLGLRISRSVMVGWAQKAAHACKPLVELMAEDTLNSNYLQVDETSLRVHGEEGRSNTTLSYIWAIRGEPPPGRHGPILLFYYSPTRSGTFIQDFLENYQGVVQTDGYVGYAFLEKQDHVTHLACWAHARRKFAEAITALKKGKRGGKASTAGIAIKQISELYKLEKEALQQNLHGEARVAFYEEKSEPILEKLRKLLENTQPKTPPNSKLGEAIKYTLKLWPRLSRCFKQGNARLDTNLVENAIRPIAVGRKNWMQAGSPAGAEASTIWFSIIETAKASGWEPYAYLRFLFDRLPNTPRENLRDLLPYVARPTT